MLDYSLGISGVFFISAVTSVLGAVFTFFLIPRTKDKSITELEMLYAKSEKRQKDLKVLDLFDPKLILKSEQNPNDISFVSMNGKETTKSI